MKEQVQTEEVSPQETHWLMMLITGRFHEAVAILRQSKKDLVAGVDSVVVDYRTSRQE